VEDGLDAIFEQDTLDLIIDREVIHQVVKGNINSGIEVRLHHDDL